MFKKSLQHNKNSHKQNQGVILIVVLWIIVVSLVMTTILASNIRLSAATVLHQYDALQNRAQLMAAVNLAKMQILLEKTSSRKSREDKGQGKESSFNGQPVQFSYQYDTGMLVRIFDLSGLINIASISRNKLKLILEKRLTQGFYRADGSEQIEALLDAWQDWIDRDDLSRHNGAEKDYYQQKSPAYTPRNSRMESIEELLLIKGFNEVFKDIDLNNIFTIYGKSATINPNFASREILLFIPAMTDVLADKIIAQRSIAPFKTISEFRLLLSIEEKKKLRTWFSLASSNYFSIIVYPKALEKSELREMENDKQKDYEIYVYKELVQYKGASQLPETMRVYPMSQFKVYQFKESVSNE